MLKIVTKGNTILCHAERIEASTTN